MKEYWTSFASLLGVLAFCQSLLQVIFPPELRFACLKFFNRVFHLFSSYCYFDITEIDGVNTNELYNAVQLYLSSSVSINGSRLSLTRALNSSAITFGLSNNDCIVDTFNGVTVLWEHVVTQRQAQTFSWRPLPEEKRGFTLRIKKRDKSLILDAYLDYVMEKANEIRRKNQERFLYTNSRGGSLDSRGHPWESVPFKHPSTFDTLAMDPVKKEEIMDDLKDFANGQSFYQKTGRAWKRGYLLYGPPGTGKSSMIAAMANYLRKKNNNNPGARNYYDSEMRSGSGSGSGCGEDGGNSITLSGLLNFTDGLWSCCGSERIFVFTTNHIEKLDPALLRSGRMDMHIYMSYCSYPALKILLKNYLGYEEGDLDDDVLKELAEVVDKAEMTPADISEVLIKNRRYKQKAVSELLELLKTRAERNLKSGSLREKNSVDIDDEEQEKRALESPKEGSEFEEHCKKEEEDEEKMK
ncbi:AAA-ATPase At5g57480-like isoform X2 [Durio zibethinus]|uniref:AAA-ATPase At5g57480-like isoform X2 n=1 Tax=Durio zibethinus TaxID=66656 RepID=A0A6P5XS35_DURZI|nr:AAA-ATPase At5g57480-like isoform X2 [Durio zibethinus]